jgi:alpha-tubulin suppressor-like RCC1 family protein
MPAVEAAKKECEPAIMGVSVNNHEKFVSGFAVRPRQAARCLVSAVALAAAMVATTGTTPASSAVSQWNHVTVGDEHACGIRVGNTLWCWGNNSAGQLGIGNTANQELPQQVGRPAVAGWASVSAGGFFGCAIRRAGTLWCWGNNDFGQLGIGSFTSQDRPQQVITPAATGWTTVAAGALHACATRSDGALWCWGDNHDLPQRVTTPAADGWASVAAGASHTCATRSDGTLWCWGDNSKGELGIGDTISQDLPQQVTTPAADGWASVTAGQTDTCATRSDGTLWCWGENFAGELGIGNTADQDLPQQVTSPAATGWTTVAAGAYHTCATRTHMLLCWGFNNHGQLGIGTRTSKDQPRHVMVPSRWSWTLIALGGDTTCATHTGPALWCWGDNGSGQLGIGSTADQRLPQQVTS